MSAFPSRRSPRHLAVCAAMVLGLGVVAAVPAWADETPPDSTPVTTTVPDTTAPPTTTAATTAPPVTSAPPVTQGPTRPGATTTTVPKEDDAATTTTAPPVDEDSIGYANTPAPQVPSADSDPLFHAARTVDADLRNVDIARIAFEKAKARSLAHDDVAAASKVITEKKVEVHAAARKRLEAADESLRAAALYAYTGYGAEQTAVDNPELNGATTVLPYVTYVRVSITQATNTVNEHTAHTKATAAALASAKANSDADAAGAAADKRAYTEAKATLVEAKDKLKRDMAALEDLVGSISDLAPGSLQKLPKNVKLPEGVHVVESPAGSIVVPAKADPRTVIALQFIVGQLGKRYVWGATGPSTYDCSGLMLRAYQAAGVTTIPRVSQAQQIWATPVSALEAQPGDLVFFGTPAYHVGVYIGGGLMINAPYTGTVVRIDKVWSSVTGFGRPIWSTPAPDA